MLEILGAPVTGADTFTVSGTIIVRDPDGIKKVTVRDRFGVELLSREFPCPELAEIEMERVGRDRLPMTIEGLSCNEMATPQQPLPLWGGPEDPGVPLPGSALRCEDSSRCLRAQSEAQRLRNQITTLCGRIAAIESRRNGYAAAAAVMFALFAGLMAAVSGLAGVPVVGWLLAAAAVAAAIVALTSGIMLGYLAYQEQQRLDAAQREIATLREQFTEAADRVLSSCSRDCITVDLDVSEC